MMRLSSRPSVDFRCSDDLGDALSSEVMEIDLDTDVALPDFGLPLKTRPRLEQLPKIP